MSLYKTTFNDPYIFILGVSFHRSKIDFENFTIGVHSNVTQSTLSKLIITVNPVLELNTAYYPNNVITDESCKLTKLIKDLYINNKKTYIKCMCNDQENTEDNTIVSKDIAVSDDKEENEHTEELVITEDTESDSSDEESEEDTEEESEKEIEIEESDESSEEDTEDSEEDTEDSEEDTEDSEEDNNKNKPNKNTKECDKKDQDYISSDSKKCHEELIKVEESVGKDK